jgi:hypothetical protein
MSGGSPLRALRPWVAGRLVEHLNSGKTHATGLQPQPRYISRMTKTEAAAFIGAMAAPLISVVRAPCFFSVSPPILRSVLRLCSGRISSSVFFCRAGIRVVILPSVPRSRAPNIPFSPERCRSGVGIEQWLKATTLDPRLFSKIIRSKTVTMDACN